MFKLELTSDEVVSLDEALSLSIGYYSAHAAGLSGEGYASLVLELTEIQHKLTAMYKIEVHKK